MIHFVTFEAFALLGKITLLYTVQWQFEKHIWHALKQQSLTGQNGAVMAILDMVCDGTVELDDKLVLTAECASLKNTLFLGTKKVRGSKFEQFVWEEDRSKFMDCVLKPGLSTQASGSTSATMFHLNLRDSWGNKVPTEVFQVRFEDYDGHMHYMLGLRDYADHNTKDRFVEAELKPNIQSELDFHRSNASIGNVKWDISIVPLFKIIVASEPSIQMFGKVESLEEVLLDPASFGERLKTRAVQVFAGERGRHVMKVKDVRFSCLGTSLLLTLEVLFPEPTPFFEAYRVSVRIYHHGLSGPSSRSASPSGSLRGTAAIPRRYDLSAPELGDEHRCALQVAPESGDQVRKQSL